MNDLQVIVKQVEGSITFNHEEIKKQVQEEVDKYNALVLEEEDVKKAKLDRADLNKKFEILDTRRKEIKKTYMKPFEDFETKVKEIGSIITDASSTIDKQIKFFEDAAKAKKKIDCIAIYTELVTDIQEYIPFDKIFNSKWENVGTSIKSIREEIQTIYDSTKMSIDTLNGMQSEKKEEALRMFKADLNLNNAISLINRFEAEKARILEAERQKQREAEERKQREEEARIRKENEERIRREEAAKHEEEERIKREVEERLANIIAAEKAHIEPVQKAVEEINNTLIEGISEPFMNIEDPFESEYPTEEAFATEEPFEVFRSPLYASTLIVTTTELGHSALKKFMDEHLISYEEV